MEKMNLKSKSLHNDKRENIKLTSKASAAG